MQECLGINITDKLIRYAKVKKDNNVYTIESYGLKFYSNIEETINQIIQETNSANIPISTEISNESYYYFNIFSLMNKSYAEKAIKTEFESFCTENHLNSKAYEGRYIYAKNLENADQSKIIYIFNNQNNLDEKKSYFSGKNLTTLVPLPTSLPNLINAEKNKNSMIVNIEDNTTVTTIVDQSIYSIDVIEEGMKEVLDRINEKENSYSKAYEVCKNTTIYTMETDYNATEENEYLKYIVPTLFKIQEELKKIKDSYKKIDNIYITGMGSIINNIDLYFKEYFTDTKVEILKPFFADQQFNVNIKDYIEVNSAIALAMQGLGTGIKTLNFLSKDWKANLRAILLTDVGSLRKNKQLKPNSNKQKFKFKFDTNMKGKFDRVEKILLRTIIMAIILIIIYSIASILLVNQINSKTSEANDVRTYISQQVALANKDDAQIQDRAADYRTYTTNLENTNSEINIKRGRKNQITTLLNKIVYNIPDKVQLTLIKNTETTNQNTTVQHIIINAQSSKYEQLAYFKAKLKNANVLENITSTEGQNDSGIITVTIEGDLKSY